MESEIRESPRVLMTIMETVKKILMLRDIKGSKVKDSLCSNTRCSGNGKNADHGCITQLLSEKCFSNTS